MRGEHRQLRRRREDAGRFDGDLRSRGHLPRPDQRPRSHHLRQRPAAGGRQPPLQPPQRVARGDRRLHPQRSQRKQHRLRRHQLRRAALPHGRRHLDRRLRRRVRPDPQPRQLERRSLRGAEHPAGRLRRLPARTTTPAGRLRQRLHEVLVRARDERARCWPTTPTCRTSPRGSTSRRTTRSPARASRPYDLDPEADRDHPLGRGNATPGGELPGEGDERGLVAALEHQPVRKHRAGDDARRPGGA